MLRSHAREDRRGTHGLCPGRIVQRIEIGAGQRRGPTADDAEIVRDAHRGARMVASDHHDTDAGTVRFADRQSDLGTWRVDDADGADVDQVAFDRGRREAFGLR